MGYTNSLQQQVDYSPFSKSTTLSYFSVAHHGIFRWKLPPETSWNLGTWIHPPLSVRAFGGDEEESPGQMRLGLLPKFGISMATPDDFFGLESWLFMVIERLLGPGCVVKTPFFNNHGAQLYTIQTPPGDSMRDPNFIPNPYRSPFFENLWAFGSQKTSSSQKGHGRSRWGLRRSCQIMKDSFVFWVG